jgi:hypothetical protein
MRGSKPGERRGGRQKGTPNRETKALRELILGALEENGGQDYLTAQARQNPVAFLTLLGKVLPMTLAGDPNAPVHTVSRIELVAVEPQPRPIAAALAGTVAAAELADN